MSMQKKNLLQLERLHRQNVVAACSTQTTGSDDLKCEGMKFQDSRNQIPFLAPETAPYIRPTPWRQVKLTTVASPTAPKLRPKRSLARVAAKCQLRRTDALHDRGFTESIRSQQKTTARHCDLKDKRPLPVLYAKSRPNPSAQAVRDRLDA
jgi:hypothetical protein